LEFTYSGGRRRELGFCSGFASGGWMRSVLLLQSVDVKDGEAGVGIGIFYIDESGSLLFLLLFFSGFRFAGEVSVGFLFLLSCERVEAWAMLRVCSFPLPVAVPVMAVLFFMFSSLRMLLLCFLCLLVLWSGASGSVWLTSMADVGGCGDKSLGPMTDFLSTNTSCGLPKLGVRPSICFGELCGFTLLDAGERALKKAQRFHDVRKKINSRDKDLDVISVLIRVFAVRLRCTVLMFVLI